MNESQATTAPTIHLVGLGPGPIEDLTLRAWELLASGKPLFVDTSKPHEAIETMGARGIVFDRADPANPAGLAKKLIEAASAAGEAIYGAPGSILYRAESWEILNTARDRQFEVKVVPAVEESSRLPADDVESLIHGGAASSRAAEAFRRLVAVMARLRAPGGCPWDREQTHTSLAIHLLEETHETLEAIDKGDYDHLEEELGDLLLQIVFHSEIAAEGGHFDIGDVVEELVVKLVDRHPHVFGDLKVSGPSEVVENWEAIKRRTKGRSAVGEGIPSGLPALLLANKVQRRLQGAGREVPVSPTEAVALAEELGRGPSEETVGRLLYQLAAIAYAAGIDPEGALRRAATTYLEA